MSIFTWVKGKLSEKRNQRAYDDYLRVEYRKEWDARRKNGVPTYWI